MEKPIDFWLRTEGVAGSVTPTIEHTSRFNERSALSLCDLVAERV